MRPRSGPFVLLLFLAVPLAAQLPSSVATRRLIVVVWERRAPEDPVLRYGAVLQANREALLQLLYDDSRALVGGDRATTALVVYPHGIAAGDHDPNLYEGVRRASPAEIVDRWLVHFVATPESADGVRGLYYSRAPTRAKLNDDLRRNVTLPLLGVNPSYGGSESSIGGRPDEAATRGVTCAPLVTAWAVHDAAMRAPAGPPFTRVDVVWVLAGDKDYDQTIPDRRIEEDLGPGMLRYYQDVQGLFVVSSDATYDSLRAAGGRLRVHHVRNVRTSEHPPRLTITNGAEPAQLDFSVHWRKPLPVVGETLRAWRVFQTLDDLPAVHWRATLTPDYRLLPGAYRWEGGAPASAMNASGAMVADLRSAVLNRMAERSGIDENLVADALAIPQPESVEPYLQHVWIPIASPVRVEARVKAGVQPLESWIYLLIAIAIAGGVLLLLLYLRKRDLYVSVHWPGALDFKLRRPEDVLAIPVTIAVQDRSPFPRRRAKIHVDLSIGRTVPGLPLLDAVPLYGVAPRQFSLTRPLARRKTVAANVLVSGRAVDLAQLRGGSHVNAAVALRVAAVDRSGLYESAAVEWPYVFDVTVVASEPLFDRILSADAISPIREKGLFQTLPRALQRVRVGWVSLTNWAEGGFVARDVTGRIVQVSVKLRIPGRRPPSPAEAHLVPVGGLDPQNLLLRNGERAEFEIYLDVGPDTFPAGAPFCEVAISVAAELAIAGEPAAPRHTKSATVPPFRWFPFVPTRHTCLDLGTSAIRLLRDGGAHDPDRWGYVLFDRPPLNEPPLNERWPEEDLPSFARFEDDGRVLLGQDALRGPTSTPNFRLSVKDVMIDNRIGGEDEIRRYVKAFSAKYYAPLVRQEIIVREPYSEAEELLVAGDADVIVASIPNDCSVRYRDAYEEALLKTGRFRHVSLIREAEAVSIWYASWRRERHIMASGRVAPVVGKKAAQSEVIIVDVGAGTTDAALAEIIEPGGLQSPKVRILSMGAASLAGRFIDRVILDEIVQRGWVDRTDLAQLSERERLEVAEGVKIAIAEKQSSYSRPPKDLYFRLELDAAKLTSLAESPVYRSAIEEIAEASLSVLLGRLPADVKLDAPRALLLSGRGARMHGLQDAIRGYLEKQGLGNLEAVDIPERLLKAAVTIGCRAFAMNYWSELRKASDASMDRMLLVYRGDDSVQAVEMLPVGASLSVPGPWVPMPSWSDAKLIATHLRRDELLDDPHVRLTEKKMLQILDGRLQPPRRQWHAPYSLLREKHELPRSDKAHRIEARVIPRPGGIDLEQRVV